MAQSGTFAANGVQVASLPVDPHRATPPTLYVEGTWGGGSIAVTAGMGGAASYALPTPVAISANGYKILPLMGGSFVLTLTGATGPSLNWYIV